jgi:hypothetical protein
MLLAMLDGSYNLFILWSMEYNVAWLALYSLGVGPGQGYIATGRVRPHYAYPAHPKNAGGWRPYTVVNNT